MTRHCRILVFGLLLLTTYSAYSQSETNTLEALVRSGAKIEKLDGAFEFTTDVSSGSVTIKSVATGEEVAMISGHRVSTLFKADGEIYFRYWYFHDPDVAATYNKGQIFHMNEALFEQFTYPIYRKFKGISAGAYTVPLRLRGIFTSNFDFESSLSL